MQAFARDLARHHVEQRFPKRRREGSELQIAARKERETLLELALERMGAGDVELDIGLEREAWGQVAITPAFSRSISTSCSITGMSTREPTIIQRPMPMPQSSSGGALSEVWMAEWMLKRLF